MISAPAGHVLLGVGAAPARGYARHMGVALNTALGVVTALQDVADPGQIAGIRKRVAPDEAVIGVRMGTLFNIAKQAVDLPPDELGKLFSHPAYEPLLAAFCILDLRVPRRLPADRSGLI